MRRVLSRRPRRRAVLITVGALLVIVAAVYWIITPPATVILQRVQIDEDTTPCAVLAAARAPQPRSTSSAVDPVRWGLLDRLKGRPWPPDFSLHREVASAISTLPCRKSPIHRIPPDVARLRLLYVVNCYDLSQLALMETQLRAAAQMCEFGWTLKVVVLTTVAPSTFSPKVTQALFCRRINASVPSSYEVFSPAIGYALSKMARRVIADQLANFDFFIYTENDMLIELHHVLLYLWELAILPREYVPGVQRFVYHDGKMTTPIVEYVTWNREPVKVANISNRWYYFPLNPHQSHFMLTREQVTALEPRCQFLSVSDPGCPFYREYMSSLQLYGGPFGHKLCAGCFLQKLIPAHNEAYFRLFLMHHLSNTTLDGGITRGGMPMNTHISGIRQCMDQAAQKKGVEVTLCNNVVVDKTGVLTVNVNLRMRM
eukprot:RCo023027